MERRSLTNVLKLARTVRERSFVQRDGNRRITEPISSGEALVKDSLSVEAAALLAADALRGFAAVAFTAIGGTSTT